MMPAASKGDRYYDVRVPGGDGTVVAEMRGHSRTIGRFFFAEGQKWPDRKESGRKESGSTE